MSKGPVISNIVIICCGNSPKLHFVFLNFWSNLRTTSFTMEYSGFLSHPMHLSFFHYVDWAIWPWPLPSLKITNAFFVCLKDCLLGILFHPWGWHSMVWILSHFWPPWIEVYQESLQVQWYQWTWIQWQPCCCSWGKNDWFIGTRMWVLPPARQVIHHPKNR